MGADQQRAEGQQAAHAMPEGGTLREWVLAAPRGMKAPSRAAAPVCCPQMWDPKMARPHFVLRKLELDLIGTSLHL